jgi:SNF family Na+-dependent transporter
MGIGVISVYSSYVFSWYYNVIVAWALVYVIVAFKNPLPWSNSIPDSDFSCPVDSMSRAEQFYRINVIRFVDESTCLAFEDGNDTVFSWPATVACLSTWIIIFLCVFKGVKSSSYIVWITVPLPLLFVFIMIFNGASLDGAGDGV